MAPGITRSPTRASSDHKSFNGTEAPQEETALQAICHGPNKLPGIPTFPNLASHRNWALNHMTAAFRHWSRSGYVEGLSGHISVRDPEYPHAFWTNPLAVHFGLLKASDMILLSDSPEDGGKVLAGNRSRPANAAGWLIHAAIHRKRRDINAACHAHTRYGKAWSAFGRRLDMINQDVCNFYGEAQAVYGQYGGLVLGEAAMEGERIADALGPNGKGILLSNHGLLTVGGTVDEAAFLFTSMENCCGVQLEVEKAGLERKIIGDEEAEFNFRMASQPETLYWEFQPYYDYEKAMSDNFENLSVEEVYIRI